LEGGLNLAKGPFGLIVASAPPWSRKAIVFKKAPSWAGNPANLSNPQKKACVALGEAAMAAYGTKGKTPYKGVSMPAVAVKVAVAVPKGEGVHGGKSKETRRTERHDAARASLDALRASIK
jgi:hypothetical protein